MIKSDTIIGRILDNAEVGPGMDVLDVACGTGVMFDYYLGRGVSSVTGIDISPEMAKIAAEKYAHEPKIQVICGDVEEVAQRIINSADKTEKDDKLKKHGSASRTHGVITLTLVESLCFFLNFFLVTCISCRINSGGAAEIINCNSRIICKTDLSI